MKGSKPAAIAVIMGGSLNPKLMGVAEFFPFNDNVLVTVRVSNLMENKSGFFGLHIHEGESCKGENFGDTKSHYNPQNGEHPNHAGDLPPLLNCDGIAYMTVLTNRFKITDIIGKTVVIHSDADDFTTQPAGNAGSKIACGVIEKVTFKEN